LTDEFLEDAAAVLVALKLVEAGAGRSEEHYFSGARSRGRGIDGRREGFTGVHGDHTAELRLDFGRGGADGVHGADALAQELSELGVVGALVFSAQDEMNA
jgi:hypothetical protein